MTVAAGSGAGDDTVDQAEADPRARGGAASRLRAVWCRHRRIIVGLALVLLATAGGGAWLLTGKPDPIVEIGIGGPLVYYDFPDVVADLKPEGRTRRFVKLGIVVEMPDDLRPRLEADRATILDALNAYLREQRPDDLTGEAGATRIRQAVTAIVNDALAPGEIKAVLFRAFILG